MARWNEKAKASRIVVNTARKKLITERLNNEMEVEEFHFSCEFSYLLGSVGVQDSETSLCYITSH